MTEPGWLQRLRRLFRKESSQRPLLPLDGHPFRTVPLETEASEPGVTPVVVPNDIPASLRSLLEKKRGTSA